MCSLSTKDSLKYNFRTFLFKLPFRRSMAVSDLEFEKSNQQSRMVAYLTVSVKAECYRSERGSEIFSGENDASALVLFR